MFKIRFVPLCEPNIGEEEIKAVTEVLRSKWILQGPKVREFEEKLAKYIGVKHAVCVSSCTAALHLSVLSFDIWYDEKVLCPNFTFPATANAIIHGNAWPVFVDVDERTFNINPDLIRLNLTPETKIIMVTHLFGQPAPMDEIMEIADEHNLAVVADGAGAFGAEYKGKKMGSFGGIMCVSCDPRKILTVGEGGIILTNDGEKADWFRMARSHGYNMETWKIHHSKSLRNMSFDFCGLNYRMTDITAAIGLEQLKKVDLVLGRRRKLASLYDVLLDEIEGVNPPYISPVSKSTYQSYVVTLDKMDNMMFIEELRKRGVQASYASRACHLEPCFKPYVGTQRVKKFWVSEHLARHTSALPLYPTMAEEDVEYVCDRIKEVLR